MYIWFPRLSGMQVGHASLTLDDGTHISWWPTEKTLGKEFKKTPRDVVSLDEDIELEGREPDKTYTVYVSDEYKIKTWWKELLERGIKYNLVDWNCCDIVIMSLIVGRLRRRIKFNIWKIIKGILRSQILLDKINTPSTVVEFLCSSEDVSDFMLEK